MSRPFTIRPFISGDEFAICALHMAAIRAIPERYYPRALIAAWADGKSPEIYVRMQEETGEIYLVAADADDRAVGFCGHLGNEIKGMYVDPAWQGKGVGTVLMQAAEAEIAAGGAEVFRVHAARSAYGFYERLGYTRINVENHTLHNGQVIEAAKYEKCLAPLLK